jgi:hypothetical protein
MSSLSAGRSTGWIATLRLRCSSDWSLPKAQSSSARPTPPPTAATRWLDEYNKARHAWSQDGLRSESGSGERTHRNLAAFFGATRFHVTDPVTIETSHEISVHDLARRVLTFSSSSPEVLGDRAGAMLRDVEQRLLPSSRNGIVTRRGGISRDGQRKRQISFETPCSAWRPG